MAESGAERIEIPCPGCGRKWRVTPRAKAARAVCRHCGEEISIPGRGEASPASPALPPRPAPEAEHRRADTELDAPPSPIRIVRTTAADMLRVREQRRNKVAIVVTACLLAVGGAGVVFFVLHIGRDEDRPALRTATPAAAVAPAETALLPGPLTDDEVRLPADGNDPAAFRVANETVKITVITSDTVPQDLQPGTGFVRGEVRNETDRTIEKLEVVCWLYAAEGTAPLAVRSQPIRWLAPTRTARFDAEWTGLDASQIRAHRVDPTARVRFAIGMTGRLTLQRDVVVKASPTEWTGTVTGELWNDPAVNAGKTLRNIRVTVNFFDDDGHFLTTADGTLLDADRLAPDQSSRLTAKWESVHGPLIAARQIEVHAVGTLE